MHQQYIAPGSPPRTFYPPPLTLDSGTVLERWAIRYECYGTLGAPAILVCPALGEGCHAAGILADSVRDSLAPWERLQGRAGWWQAFIGPGLPLDTERYFVIAPSQLGNCLGTTGPVSVDEGEAHLAGPPWQRLSITDIATAHALLLEHLGIERAMITGGSLGGMAAIELARLQPQRCSGLLVFAAPTSQTAWAAEILELLEGIVACDPEPIRPWGAPPAAAYRHAVHTLFLVNHTRHEFIERAARQAFADAGSLRQAALRFAQRIEVRGFRLQLDAARHYGTAPDRADQLAVLRQLDIPKHFVGYTTDNLYGPQDIEASAEAVAGRHEIVSSFYGHIGFLLDTEATSSALRSFLAELHAD
jgi:homoserine O-acetyltransferase